MPNFYITFGQVHTHSHNGKTLDKDCVGVIKADLYMTAHKIAFEWFGREWSMLYEEDEISPGFMEFFPKGIIKLNSDI